MTAKIVHSTSARYVAVQTARARLKAIETKHDQLIDVGTMELKTVGRNYAAAVHEYSRAVMEWLSWLDIEGNRSTSRGKT